MTNRIGTRTAIVGLVACLIATACTESPGDPAEAPEPRPPNVLIILTDDQPVDSLGVMPATRTWFRRGGVEFTDAYVTTPFCCPSRASISTGLYTHNHGVRRGMHLNPDALGDHKATLEYQLRDKAGYRTAFFGKYLNSWDLDNDPPHLDRWAIFPNSAPDGYRGAEWNVDGNGRTVRRYSTTYIRERGLRFLRNNADRPWLMYLSPAAPHEPFEAEREYRDAPVGGWARWKERHPAVAARRIDDKHPRLKRLQKPRHVGKRDRQGQLRTLMSVDDLVAEVMHALEDTGQRDDTLAFFLSDNGYLWGEHGLTQKMLPYTRSIKVPFMMRWPAGGVEAAKDDRLVANIDLAATVYDAVGLADPPITDGRSLLDGTWQRDRLHLEFYRAFRRPTWASTLTRNDQYIEWYRGPPGSAVTFREYYDLRSDPHQLRNLAATQGDRRGIGLAARSAQLAADQICSGASCP